MRGSQEKNKLPTRQHRQRLKQDGQFGYSLLELLIAMTIIALIFSVLIPNLIAAIDKANCEQAEQELDLVNKAWYPGPGSGAQPKKPCAIELNLFTRRLHGRIEELLPPGTVVPPNDPWERAYVFGLTADEKHLVMCSGGKNGFSVDINIGQSLTGLEQCDCEGQGGCGDNNKTTKELVMISP